MMGLVPEDRHAIAIHAGTVRRPDRRAFGQLHPTQPGPVQSPGDRPAGHLAFRAGVRLRHPAGRSRQVQPDCHVWQWSWRVGAGRAQRYGALRRGLVEHRSAQAHRGGWPLGRAWQLRHERLLRAGDRSGARPDRPAVQATADHPGHLRRRKLDVRGQGAGRCRPSARSCCGDRRADRAQTDSPAQGRDDGAYRYPRPQWSLFGPQPWP